jgi:hypothetical protein
MADYTYLQLRTRINGGIKGKIGILVNDRETINDVVRQVVEDIDLRSMIRNEDLSPDLSSDTKEYDYPTGMKNYALIDVLPKDTSKKSGEYQLTIQEDFCRGGSGVIAVSEEGTSKLLINSAESADTESIVRFYSNLPWKNIAGEYIVDSTSNDDVLSIDPAEFNLFVQKGIEIAGSEVDEMEASDRAKIKYLEDKRSYEMRNPSMRKSIITTYAQF